jgi:hypothetical protein
MSFQPPQPQQTGRVAPGVPPRGAELFGAPRPRRPRGWWRWVGAALAVVALAGTAVADMYVRAHPTEVVGQASAGGGQPALESPKVPDGFSLVRDEDAGYAVLVPTGFFKFELSEQNLDSIENQLAENPDPELADVLQQSRDLVDAGGVLYFYDETTGDTEILQKVPDLPELSDDFLGDMLAQMKDDGIDPESAEITDVLGVPAIVVTFRHQGDDAGHDTLVTQLFLTGFQSGWVLTLDTTELDDASRDTVVNSLRVV